MSVLNVVLNVTGWNQLAELGSYRTPSENIVGVKTMHGVCRAVPSTGLTFGRQRGQSAQPTFLGCFQACVCTPCNALESSTAPHST